MSTTNNTIKVNGEIYWAQSLYKVSDMSGKYQFDLCNLSDKAAEAMEKELGVKVRTRPDKPEQGKYVTIKSAKYPFKLEDTEGKIIPENVIIGNGTKATVVLSSYSWTDKRGNKCYSPSSKKIVVTNLIEYVKPDADSQEDDTL